MSTIVVVRVPSPLSAVVFLSSSPRHAAIPLATGGAESLLLPALGNHARSQFRVVRHPPWQQMCADL